ncbi:uncharacterized protein At4g15970 [Dendrobium catenatum]|uniref:uncharacterized protein At4g15970 n=1 Tax=Dendrobium catenatum TaxID=906689 RepID=UPI0009F6BEA5|nr:uncharacterized protein At4g15970 [Dendrobium catenatum]
MQPAPNGVTVHSVDVSQAAKPVRPESSILRRLPVPLIFLIAFGLSFTLIYRAAGPIPLLTQWNRADSFDLDKERLARVLKASAMEDNTVILTTLNAAWASNGTIIDLFLESFQIGNDTRSLLDHLVIIAFDKKAYLRCRAIHAHCFALATNGVDFSVQENFMTEGYLKMMWRRIDFLRIVLEMGYNFIFTDADIMWFRNPLSRFFPDGDFQIACDQFNGNPYDRHNRPNGGFNYVKSSNRTIKFYKFWYTSRVKHPELHDQDVLNIIKFDPFIDEIGLKMRFLSTAFFGGICQPSRDFNLVCTMHANCCIGLNRKINDLSVMLEDWRSYMALPTALKTAKMPVWRVPQNCSLKPLH